MAQKYSGEVTVMLPNDEEMNELADTQHFLETTGLSEPAAMKTLLASVPQESPLLFNLAFQASFASRIFAIIQREGSSTQGFERMQQSLTESVQTVVKLLRQIEMQYDVTLGIDLNKAPSKLIGDLALFKQWLNMQNDK